MTRQCVEFTSAQKSSRLKSATGARAWRLRDVVLAAAALLYAGVGVAQQNPGAQGPPMQQQQQMQEAPGTPNGVTPTTPTNSENTYSDVVFVEDTIQDNNTEVQMSQLAQTKSQSPDVQQFGQKMVQIHNALNDQLKPAAKQLGANDSKEPSKKEKQQIAQLASLSGPDFDTAYIMAMAKEQQKTLRAFKDEENNAQSPGLQQAAKADEPVLTQHYEILQKLAQAHNVTITASK